MTTDNAVASATPAAPTAAPSAPVPAPTSAAERMAVEFQNGPDNSGVASFEDLDKIISHDPFPGGEPAAPAQPNPEVPAVPAEGAATPAQPASTQNPAAPVANPELEQLRNDLRARDELIANLAKGVQTPAQPAPEQPKDTIPAHMYQLPQQLLAQIRSDDPAEAATGMQNLVSLTIRTAHKAIREEFMREFEGLKNQQIPTMLSSYMNHQQQSKAIYEDFYGKYKDLNRPELFQVITQTALNLAKTKGYTSWNDKFRDDVATAVYGILGKQVPGASPAVPATIQPPMLGGGTARPVEPARAPVTDQAKLQQEIADTLGF